jgi:hypothetical protein
MIDEAHSPASKETGRGSKSTLQASTSRWDAQQDVPVSKTSGPRIDHGRGTSPGLHLSAALPPQGGRVGAFRAIESSRGENGAA